MHVELDSEKQDWLYRGTGIPKKYKDKIPEDVCEELRNEANVSYKYNSFTPVILIYKIFFLQWENFLRYSDIRMQRLIIGFHRIATTEQSLEMRNLFQRARDQAQAVLCEIRSIMNKVNIAYVLQTSEQLTDKDANDSWFNWIMLREYFNQLEYISEVSHLIVNSEPA